MFGRSLKNEFKIEKVSQRQCFVRAQRSMQQFVEGLSLQCLLLIEPLSADHHFWRQLRSVCSKQLQQLDFMVPNLRGQLIFLSFFD